MVDYMHPRERPATVFGIAGHKHPKDLVLSAYSAAFLGALSVKAFDRRVHRELPQRALRSSRNNRQTKTSFPDRIPIRFIPLMRAMLPISVSLLRSWTVLPSGL